jgi:SAM-dependent methyltransferase
LVSTSAIFGSGRLSQSAWGRLDSPPAIAEGSTLQGPRYQQDRPADIHRATPWHRYAHHVRTLAPALEELARELRVGPGHRVLDYGCADVPYRHFFPRDAEFLPADLPGNPRASLVLEADTRVPADDATFDAVLSTQVLEHVEDPSLYLSECFRVLRPGGRMLLSTHGIFVYHPDPDDYWRWTPAGLRRAVGTAGFEIDRSEGIVGLGASGLQLFQDAFYYELPRRIRPAFALVMQTLIALVDRIKRQRGREYDAQVLAVVARKP